MSAENQDQSKPVIDKIIHEPARLMIMSQLYVVDSMDFVFLMRQTEMTQGNLSSHLSKLEQTGYVEIEKGFAGRKPRTIIRLSESGRGKFEQYVKDMSTLFTGLNV